MRFSQRALRDALGTFATGVCIITVHPPHRGPFGMTVNSFASVSLDPPLVLWSLQNDSECFSAFDNASQFGVNILNNTQVELSNYYAQKGDHNLLAGSYRYGRSGAVVLKDVVTSFECNIEARYPGGDHTIFIGRVMEVHSRPAAKPLVFYGGQYRELK